MADLVSLEEAQRLVLERARPLDAERVPIDRGAGRVLAERALAAVDLPPFASSAMDGFAVRSEDTASSPLTLSVVARIAAGQPATRSLERGEAMAISTGGTVPDGADAVVPIELVDEQDTAIVLNAPVARGANVRPRGGDAAAGRPVLE
ncbi:MAG: hypothetical protein M3377_00415, partial [Actinomycetota bacterium]|nr:hypothetical protein [Actinomycetota bacterium]